MLTQSDVSIGQALSTFAIHGIETGLIVPTETEMSESRMDVKGSLKKFLQTEQFLNYSAQTATLDDEVVRQAYFIDNNRLITTQVSFYRSNSKNGNAGVWFHKLNDYAKPYNLLALFIISSDLYVINCSKSQIIDSFTGAASAFSKIVIPFQPPENPVILELLGKLRKISALGYVDSITPGDTGVGMTLEYQLGIGANTRTDADYRGVEIKSKRVGSSGREQNRTTLFSQAPNWRISPIGSGWNLLSQYGYRRTGGKLRLAHQMDTVRTNSTGCMLELDLDNDLLKVVHSEGDPTKPTHLISWEMSKLRERLLEKHNETLWVSALRQTVTRTQEKFHYIEAQHTQKPIIGNFEILIEAGLITLDFTMKATDETKKSIRDHGYLFRINSKDIPALIPLIGTYDLTRIEAKLN